MRPCFFIRGGLTPVANARTLQYNDFMKPDRIVYADDDLQTVNRLLRLRLPSLLLGLVLGIVLSFATSRFEEVLVKNVEIAFFIPFIVYFAAAVGSQTQSIYARDLKSGRAKFHTYLLKESALGIILGAAAGLISALVTTVWFDSRELTLAVSVSLFAAVATAPLIALVVTEVFQLEHKDPAVGAGPIATVIQDTISILIFGFIASAIIL